MFIGCMQTEHQLINLQMDTRRVPCLYTKKITLALCKCASTLI